MSAPIRDAAAKDGDVPPAFLPRVSKMSLVQPEDVQWLWKPYIARGKLTLLDGDPDTLKSFLALQLAAILSRGWPLPDPTTGVPSGAGGDPVNTLLMISEDGLADTIRPRLDSMDADPSRIFALDGVTFPEMGGKESERDITLADIEVIEDAAKRYTAALVVVDMLNAWIGADVDIYRDNEVRAVLKPLNALAERTGAALLLIRHLTKSSGTKAIHRGLGSIAFTGAARSVLMAVTDPDDQYRVVLTHAKSNLSRKGKSLSYTVDEAGSFKWCGVVDITADELLNTDQQEARSSVANAESFLREELKAGARGSAEIFEAAKRERISTRTLYRAKGKVGVDSFKDGGEWKMFIENGTRGSK